MKKVFAGIALMAGLAGAAEATTVFGVDENNNLIRFNSAAPGTVLSSVKITGVDSSLQSIDFRPLNNSLFGLSADRTVYRINTSTGVATAIGGQLDLRGSVYGFDFNPTIDRVRIVSNTDNNYVFNPNTGGLTGNPTTTNLAYAAGDVNEGANPGVSAAAYTTSVFGAPGASTQLYVIDTDLDVLARQNNNGGVLNTVGSLGFDLGSRTSFDIVGEDAFVFNGTRLFRVDLNTGSLTALGSTDRALFGIAIAAVPEPSTWAMMLLGFGAVGYSVRRRTATIQAPATA